jgi:hypothetical protein
MTSSAEVIVADARDPAPAQTTDVGSAKTSHVTAAKAAHVTAAAKAAHVTAATKAAHVTATTKTTTVSAAAAATATGLRTRGNKATGKQRTCQNHYQSSSHDLSPLGWADVPPQDLRQMSACLSKTSATSR